MPGLWSVGRGGGLLVDAPGLQLQQAREGATNGRGAQLDGAEPARKQLGWWSKTGHQPTPCALELVRAAQDHLVTNTNNIEG